MLRVAYPCDSFAIPGRCHSRFIVGHSQLYYVPIYAFIGMFSEFSSIHMLYRILRICNISSTIILYYNLSYDLKSRLTMVTRYIDKSDKAISISDATCVVHELGAILGWSSSKES